MATHDYNLANQSGSSFRTDLNNCLAAVQSLNSNASSPSSTVAFMLWADSNNGTLKIRNSANSAWVELLQLDGTLTMEDGAEATPGLAFRDDLNTGFWSSAADTLDISTGGTKRLSVTSAGLTMQASNIILGDSGSASDDRIVLGAGSDLSVYHDGTYSRITNSTGTFLFDTVGDFQLRNTSTEKYIVAVANGAAELYYDNTKTFETYSGGTLTTGNCKATGGFRIENDTGKIELGASGDLEIYHSGSHSFIRDTGTGMLSIDGSQINLHNAAGSEIMIQAIQNGAVSIYYDNAVKLATLSNGITVTGKCDIAGGHLYLDDDYAARFGDGEDLLIYHSSGHSYVENHVGDLYIIQGVDQGNGIFLEPKPSEAGVKIFRNGAVELFYDNTKKFETTSAGCKVSTGVLDFDDSVEARFGTGNDLKVYHSGSDSFIKSNTGDLYIDSDDELLLRNTSTEKYIRCVNNGTVVLYYNNSTKLETTSSGIAVTGSCSGCDFNFSNMNPASSSANEVDGTRGSWTLQEGADDLFLINRNNGKQYKFNLIEMT